MDLRLPFEMYQSGMPLDRVFDEIEKNAMAVLRRDAGFDLSFLQNYEMIKPKLMLQVVGVEGNEEILKEMGMPDLPAMPGPQIYVAIHTDVLFVECLLRKPKCRN